MIERIMLEEVTSAGGDSLVRPDASYLRFGGTRPVQQAAPSRES